jgi:hypothetical protein
MLVNYVCETDYILMLQKLIKEIYKRSRRISFIKEIFLENIQFKLLFYLYIVMCLLFIFIQYKFNNENISIIFFVIYLITNFVILHFLNKIIDEHFKKILCLDNKIKYSSYDLSYLLFINTLKSNISLNRLEIIIKQFELENVNEKNYYLKYFSIFSTIGLIFFRVFSSKLFDTNFEYFVLLMILTVIISIIFITVYDMIELLFNKEKYKNNDIIKKLKQYLNNRKYKLVK